MNTKQQPFASHLKLAHHFWNQLLEPSNWAIDATCGNGHDALFLSEKVQKLFCIDIQPEAIKTTRMKVPSAYFYLGCHSLLPEEAFGPQLKLITYNLGYLPGSDKIITTRLETTKKSLEMALNRMPIGAVVSITFYPGHNEGLREFQTLLPHLEDLDSNSFCVSTHNWINRNKAPILAFILKLN